MENKEANGNTPVEPFDYVTTRHADFSIADSLKFLASSPGGIESMERFSERLDEELDILCQSIAEEIAETGRYHKRVDMPASAYHARPTYRLDVQTSRKRARRSGSGLWYVYYTIADANNDGKPDRIVVLSVEHSSSQPFAINAGQFDERDEDTDE